jgi:gliding motility-associated-like protein
LSPLWGQSDTLCIANPTNNYYVIETPGSSYNWETQGNGTINSGQGTSAVNITWQSASGIYQLTVTETSVDGCPGQPQTLNILMLDYNFVQEISICAGQTYTLPDGVVVGSSGTYVSVLPSSISCDSIITTNLIVNDVIVVEQDVGICAGESYTLPDGNVVSSSGVYTSGFISVSGCDSIVTTNLTVNDLLTSSVNEEICSGSNFTLPDGTIVSEAGVYIITVSSISGCDSVITTNLMVSNILTATVNAEICFGSSYILPDGSTVSNSGSFDVTLVTNSGCDSVVTTNLNVLEPLASNVNAEICAGSFYLLPNGTSVDEAGVHETILASTSGCDSVITTNLSVAPAIDLNVTAQNNILSICFGQSTLITATGATEYQWSPSIGLSAATGNEVIASPVESITYYVNGASGNCTALDSISITVLPAPTVTLNPSSATICFGESVQLNAQGAETYQWIPSFDLSCSDCANPIATPTETITYQVVGSLGTCNDTASTSISVINVIAAIEGDTSVCLNDSLLLTASGGGTYLWNTGDTTSTVSFTPLVSGYYYVLVSIGECTDSAAIYINVKPRPIIIAGNDTTIFPGGTVILNFTGSGYNFIDWSPPFNLSCADCANPIANPEKTTTYCVTANNIYNCPSNDCMKITIDSICGSIFIPNVFAPADGGDKENDCFKVYGTDCVETMELAVFNRWGEKVFETKNLNDCWDGTFRGQELNSDAFVYYFKAILYSGDNIIKQGNVTLLR